MTLPTFIDDTTYFTAAIGNGYNAAIEKLQAEVAAAKGELSSLHSELASISSGPIPDAFRIPTVQEPSAVSNSQAITEAVMPEHGPSNIDAINGFRHPLYLGEHNDPLWTLTAEAGGSGMGAGVKVHAPAAMVPASESDKHLAVLGPEGTEFDMWHASVSGLTVTYKNGTTYALNGDGVKQLGGGASATQSGVALGFGVIRADELRRGKIDHALAIVINYCAKVSDLTYGNGVKTGVGTGVSPYIYPATAGCRAGSVANLPPSGARCQLMMSVAEILALKLPQWMQTIYIALAEYGGYVMDTGGTESLKHDFQILLEHGGAYSALGRPDPFLTYAKELHPGAGEGGGGAENRVVKEGSSYYYELYENTPESRIKWATALKWMAPPPNPIGYSTAQRSAPLPPRLWAPNSPVNAPLSRPYEGLDPSVLTPSVVT